MSLSSQHREFGSTAWSSSPLLPAAHRFALAMFRIDTRSVPADETLLIERDLDDDILQLAPDDPQQPKGPLKVRAEASLVSGNLLLRGDFSQVFRVSCVRCSEPFDLTVRLADHALLAPLGNDALIDLTDQLREDILLALPGFPHCDADLPDGTKSPRTCPAAGSFQPEQAFEPLDPESGAPEEPSGWGELDQLKFEES